MGCAWFMCWKLGPWGGHVGGGDWKLEQVRTSERSLGH
jgi:hypothetical protein